MSRPETRSARGVRRSPHRYRFGMGSECEASDHTGGPAVDGDPTRRRQAEPTRDDGGTGSQRVTGQRGVRTRGARRYNFRRKAQWVPPLKGCSLQGLSMWGLIAIISNHRTVGTLLLCGLKLF